MQKLEDLTEEELELYEKAIRWVNDILCSGQRLFITNGFESVLHLVKAKFEANDWIINDVAPPEGEFTKWWIFTSSLQTWNLQAPRDNVGTHSERYREQKPVLEIPPVS